MSVNTTTEIQAVVNVGMGQAAVARNATVLQAVLGSCVGLALYHPRLHATAMAHVVLPAANGRADCAAKFADTAVPFLIASLAEIGVPSAGLIAKITGASSMFGNTGPIQIGESNIVAVRLALKNAGISIVGEDLGGGKGRKVRIVGGVGQMQIEIVGRTTVVL